MSAGKCWTVRKYSQDKHGWHRLGILPEFAVSMKSAVKVSFLLKMKILRKLVVLESIAYQGGEPGGRLSQCPDEGS
jgi:hypothetical protein